MNGRKSKEIRRFCRETGANYRLVKNFHKALLSNGTHWTWKTKEK